MGLGLNLCNHEAVLEGYVNIGLTDEFNGGIVIGDPLNLDWYCADEVADEVRTASVLAGLDAQTTLVALENWFRKLKPGGVMRLSSEYVATVANPYASGELPDETILGFFSEISGANPTAFLAAIPGMVSSWQTAPAVTIEVTKPL